MIIAKCDRCGNLSERKTAMTVHVGGWRGEDDAPVHYDLCPNCTDLMAAWIESSYDHGMTFASDKQIGVIRDLRDGAL